MSRIYAPLCLTALFACQPITGTKQGATSKDAPAIGSERVVDASSLSGKMMMGYQGWFGCPGDGSELSQWMHWSPNTAPTPVTAGFYAWPDTSEFCEH